MKLLISIFLKFLVLGNISSAFIPKSKSAPWVAAKRDPWMQKHLEFLGKTKREGGSIKVLFIGDSITADWQSNGKSEWEKHYKPLGAADYGIRGDYVENVLWRVKNGEVGGIKPKVVVLMIGTNNIGIHSDSDIVKGIQTLVLELKKKLPLSKILLLGILPRGEAGKTTSADNINALLAKLDDKKTVRFLNMKNQFYNVQSKGLKPELYVGDKLHLTPQGYQVWSAAMQSLFQQFMKA